MKQTYFYHDKPLFGLDIGHDSLKVMQIMPGSAGPKKTPVLAGYGAISFENGAIEEGEIVKPEAIADALLTLFSGPLIGTITTRRVAFTIPSYRTFTRSVELPKLHKKELDEAVQLEAEQYIPVPLDQLYLDYAIMREHKEALEIFAVAVPQKIVDSYVTLADMAGLEPVLIETTMSAAARLFSHDTQSDIPTVIIDFGSMSSDISIYDRAVLVTGTVQSGGLVFNSAIKQALGVSAAEAALIKTKYGLGHSKKQKEILEALEPSLEPIVKEIRRMIRYYEERFGTKRPISQVIAFGGGANMPGLTEYFTNALRIAVRSCDPWLYFNHNNLSGPTAADSPMYATVAGLAFAPPKGALK